MIEAAMRYRTLLDRGDVVGVRAFVPTCDADIQDELQEFLELCLVMEEPEERITLTPQDDDRARRIWQQKLAEKQWGQGLNEASRAAVRLCWVPLPTSQRRGPRQRQHVQMCRRRLERGARVFQCRAISTVPS